MCGFAGFVDPSIGDKRPVIEAMATEIIHRGPDSDGYFIDDDVALGFRRLSIIDLSHGHQPIVSDDAKRVICFNGEIYNYRELREELIAAGHEFRTGSDTEVILRGYETWGEDVLQRLRGMFAFVIWNTETRTLFGARDPFGIKPFYYQHNGDKLIFGSEVKAFLPQPNFVKEVNTDVLPDYLSFEYIPSNETLFKGVKKLLGGECFTFNGSEMRVSRYHSLRFSPDETKDLTHWTREIQNVVEDSVEAHQVADVEVGCFLSSGIDSSYITKEMTKTGNKIKAFSVGYAEQKYSELSYARDFAQKIGAEFHEREIGADETFNAVPRIQYLMDEPLPNPSALPLFFLTEEAAKQVKVVVSGEGADELFGGYNQYREPIDYAPYQKVPAPIRKAVAAVAKKLPDFRGKRFLLRNAQPLPERFFRNNYVFSPTEREQVLAKPIAAPSTAERVRPLFDEVADMDDVTQMQHVDIHTWMLYDILQKADKMSMAHSLELRVPFLDLRVFDVARKIPSRFRVTKENTKIALRRTALAEIPERTANKKKLGFPVPLNDWLRQEPYFSTVRDLFASDTAAEFFNREHILNMLEIHRSGVDGYMKRIWSIYCFLVWHDEFFVKR
ncbi:asparagine synthase (glutamine-hydrolyzing) [Dermabacteraceae bacterium TAE3-ERU27]|nr:asparagine synthase (glutamine-hydrolyzing) [Dermabacteraceae bacterium TAE3-ERU27]